MTTECFKHSWPTDEPIIRITFHGGSYQIGTECQKLEKSEKHGEYAMIPYVRVLGYDGHLIAEFCQHQLTGTFYR